MVGFSVQDNYQALENTNETSEFVRNQHKAELSPDAKATPAATPKPPSPSTTGASSSASSSSSSVFSSWKFRPSFSKYALTLGPLGVLGAGALLYSLSGNADGGSDDRRKSSKWKAEIPFFNRSNEQKVFDKNLKGIPGVIAVLVGPPSCGKSRFLKEMVDRLGLGQDPPPVIFINSRLVRVNGPEAISKALVDEVASQDNLLNLSKFPDLVQGILEQVSMVAGVKTPVGNVLFDLGELAKLFKKDEKNLTETIKKLKILFKSIASLPRKPVIVIDEANNLMDWTEPGPSQPKLKTMLDFVVAISKEANLVHVILATSDYFLASWLKVKGVATNNFRIHVLGDVTEEEAREFVYGTAVGATIDPLFVAAPDVAAPVVTWPGIINDPSEPIAVPGFDPEIIPKRDELPEWTEGQWATVLQRITTAPHHAVLRNELAKDLGKGDGKTGKKILLSMVKYNLLALRPYSTLARDLPLEVYGVDEEEVVTLPSPGHIWAAKRILMKRKRDADKSAAELAEKAKSKPKKYFNLF
ncbi:putative ATP-binding protein [Nannochloris sp. 'desiccata']|nr:putative ATP-binding protein [Chlorella desiccata (nom. nud.)]